MPNGRADFDRAIADIRAQYDIDLTPDEDGTATVAFSDDISCTLEVPQDSSFVYFHAAADRAPPRGREALYEAFLRWNVFGIPSPSTWLGLDPETEELLICGALPLEGISAGRLNEMLTSLANLVQDVRDAIRQGNFMRDQATEPPASTAGTQDEHLMSPFGAPLRG